MRITTSEILDALAAAVGGTAPDEAMTVEDMVRATGVSVKRVRESLKVLAAQDRLGVHRVTRQGIDGRQAVVPAYTIKPAPRATRKG